MRNAAAILLSVTLGTIGATTSRFDWANYDSNRLQRLSGVVHKAENIEGVVVLGVKTESDRSRSTMWVVPLGTVDELRRAGLALEFKLGLPVEIVAWQHRSSSREARATEIALNHSDPVVLKTK